MERTEPDDLVSTFRPSGVPRTMAHPRPSLGAVPLAVALRANSHAGDPMANFRKGTTLAGRSTAS